MLTATPSTAITSYPHVEEDQLVTHIVALAPVQAIFLLAAVTTASKTSGPFLDSPLTATHTSHHHLLLLIESEDTHAAACLQDKLESHFPHRPQLTAMVLNTTTFFSWAAQGHYFAHQVLTKAHLLYRSTTLLLPIPSPVNQQERAKELQLLFTATSGRIEAFLAGADLYRIRKDYKLSAFMLHQATEQALWVMLIIRTGYRAATHSIDRLLRYTSMVCPQLLHLFPTQTEKEKKLFSLLQKAYIHSRYTNDYTITCEELTQLTEKVQAIRNLFLQQKPTV